MTARDEIQALTRAEILRQRSDYSSKRDAMTAELAAICAERLAGRAPPAQPIPANIRDAYERAQAMLNGRAPAALTLPPAGNREDWLFAERAAVDIVLAVLSQEESEIRVVEAVADAEAHRAEWAALCRDIVITSARLEALERKADEMARKWDGIGRLLPMVDTIGRGSITGADWSADPLRFAQSAGIRDGIVKKSEIERAKNV